MLSTHIFMSSSAIQGGCTGKRSVTLARMPPLPGMARGGGDGEPDALICLQDPDFVIWDFRMKELRLSEVVMP